MRNQPIRPAFDGCSTRDEDKLDQAAVLAAVIDFHPVLLTVSELIRQLSLRPGEFSERDRIERAVDDLAGGGLLHRQDYLNRPDALVTPTRAAHLACELLTSREDGR